MFNLGKSKMSWLGRGGTSRRMQANNAKYDSASKLHVPFFSRPSDDGR